MNSDCRFASYRVGLAQKHKRASRGDELVRQLFSLCRISFPVLVFVFVNKNTAIFLPPPKKKSEKADIECSTRCVDLPSPPSCTLYHAFSPTSASSCSVSHALCSAEAPPLWVYPPEPHLRPRMVAIFVAGRNRSPSRQDSAGTRHICFQPVSATFRSVSLLYHIWSQWFTRLV